MAKVTLQDIFQAQLWTSDDFNKAPELQNIIKSGLLVSNTQLQNIVDSKEAGVSFELPYIDEPNYSEPYTMDDSDTEIPTEGFSWESQMAVLGLYAKAYKYSNLAAEVGRDSDPAKVIRDIVGNYWGRDLQRRVVATMRALSQKLPENTLDVADDSTDQPDVALSPQVIIDAIAKVGDHQDKFNFLFLHSKVYTDLKKQDLIDMVVPSQNPALEPVPFYGKYRVIVNDLMPVVQGTNKTKYISVIAQKGMFAYANKKLSANIPALELYRNPKTGYGAGDTEIIARRGHVLHPIGWSYLKNGSPTLVDLADPNNWEAKFESKSQKFVAIVTN